MSSHSPGRAPCVPSPNVLLMSSWSCQPRSLLPGLRKLSLLAGMVLGTRGCPGDLSRGGRHQALPGGDGHHLQSSREGAWEPRVGRGGAGVTSYKITTVFRREFSEHSENGRGWQRGLEDVEIPGCAERARSSLRGRRVADGRGAASRQSYSDTRV